MKTNLHNIDFFDFTSFLAWTFLIFWPTVFDKKFVKWNLTEKKYKFLCYLDLIQRNDVLLVVLFLVDDDIAIDQDIIEQKELPGLGFFSASFGQDSFAN